jgi:hypothetical protein
MTPPDESPETPADSAARRRCGLRCSTRAPQLVVGGYRREAVGAGAWWPALGRLSKTTTELPKWAGPLTVGLL